MQTDPDAIEALAQFLSRWLDEHEIYECNELAEAIAPWIGPLCRCENQEPHPCHCLQDKDGNRRHFAMCDWAEIQRNEYLARNGLEALARIEFQCQEVDKAAVLGRFGSGMRRVHVDDLRKIYHGIALPDYKPPISVE